jgi:hypothetical protein
VLLLLLGELLLLLLLLLLLDLSDCAAHILRATLASRAHTALWA